MTQPTTAADETTAKLTVQKMSYPVVYSQEIIDDMAGMPTFTEIIEHLEEQRRAFEAPPPEEQARILAEREAARLARTCEHCGCDPEEHGS